MHTCSSMARKQVDSFILDERIGGGSYGEVWRGRNMGCAQCTVALRCVRRKVEAKVARLRSEVRLLRQVSHANILRFHGLRKSPSHFYLALEYCAGGDLAQLLRVRGPLPEADSWRFCVQITAGLLALHCESFVHGNLQPRSVLLSDSSEDPKLKLANFTSKSQPNQYTAPEVLRGEPCDGQADMWSAGAILYEMLFGRPPFRGNSRSQLLASHFSKEEVSFAEETAVTGEGRAFCRSLLGRHCAERLTSRDCARHAYVKRGPLPSKGSRRHASMKASSTTSPARGSCTPMDRLQVTPRVGEIIRLAQIWPLCSARLACSKIAQRFLDLCALGARDLEGLPHAAKNAGEADAEIDSETDGKVATSRRCALQLGPGGLSKSLLDRSLNRDPVTYFVVGQLQYSHFFRLRTARLFPRILYA